MARYYVIGRLLAKAYDPKRKIHLRPRLWRTGEVLITEDTFEPGTALVAIDEAAKAAKAKVRAARRAAGIDDRPNERRLRAMLSERGRRHLEELEAE